MVMPHNAKFISFHFFFFPPPSGTRAMSRETDERCEKRTQMRAKFVWWLCSILHKNWQQNDTVVGQWVQSLWKGRWPSYLLRSSELYGPNLQDYTVHVHLASFAPLRPLDHSSFFFIRPKQLIVPSVSYVQLSLWLNSVNQRFFQSFPSSLWRFPSSLYVYEADLYGPGIHLTLLLKFYIFNLHGWVLASDGAASSRFTSYLISPIDLFFAIAPLLKFALRCSWTHGDFKCNVAYQNKKNTLRHFLKSLNVQTCYPKSQSLGTAVH